MSAERPLSGAPLRVLMVSWEYPPVIEGGLARAVGKLTAALGDVAGGDVEVDVLARGPLIDLDGDDDGPVVHRVPSSPRPRDFTAFMAWVDALNDDLLAAGRALVAGREGRAPYDVVHGHDWLVATAAKRIADEAGAAFLTTVHATEYGRHQGWVHAAPQARVHRTERWMVHVADRVLVCSHYMRDHVADVFDLPLDRLTVAPNAIDPSDLRPVHDGKAMRATLAPGGEPLVLLVGRLVYEKGFQDALRAIAAIRAGGSDARFVVAGSGEHEWELKRLAARLGIADAGTFLGWIDDGTLHALYRIADVTVIPSRYEPFGLVALEAMASGCACVVADTGGLREVVPDDVGLRVAPGDPRALAAALDRVLEDDALRTRLGVRAAEHVLGFGWPEVAERVAAVYRALRPPVLTTRRR